LKNNARYNLAIEERHYGLAEYSAHLIHECLLRDQFNVTMVVKQSEINSFKDYHREIGINSNVNYLSLENLDFNQLKPDAMLNYHTNGPGPMFRDKRSPINIPRITMTHTLTDKNVIFPTQNPNSHPMGQYNVYFASGPAAFKGSWEDYIKIHPSTLKTVKIFRIGRPRTDVLFSNKYDRTKTLSSLGLNPGKKTVLYAPTFQKEASLEQCGLDIINIVSSMDINLLIRLHHLSLALDNPNARIRGHGGKDWRKILKKIDSENINVRFVEGDSTPYYVSSDLLIGDVSGACYEFLLQNKPVVFIDTPKFFVEHGMGGISYWGRTSGDIVSNLDDLPNVVRYNLDNYKHKEMERQDLISELVYNLGHATQTAVDTIIGLINRSISYPKWGRRLNRYGMSARKLPYRIKGKVAKVYHTAKKHVFFNSYNDIK
tara:strand:+ start:504 stop:1793 length:1290 start_codon:yes stop_codon:yes gene_type:complete